MKIKVYSRILAGIYALFGAALFLVIPKFEVFFSGLAKPLPFLTRAVFAVGPFGWLCLSVAVGTFVVLKDLRFRSRLLSPVFTFVLVLWMGCMAVALVFPLTFLFSNSGPLAKMPPNQGAAANRRPTLRFTMTDNLNNLGAIPAPCPAVAELDR